MSGMQGTSETTVLKHLRIKILDRLLNTKIVTMTSKYLKNSKISRHNNAVSFVNKVGPKFMRIILSYILIRHVKMCLDEGLFLPSSSTVRSTTSPAFWRSGWITVESL